MSILIKIDYNSIVVHCHEVNNYQIAYEKLTNTCIGSLMFDDFQFLFNNEKQDLHFIHYNNATIFYEDCEKLLYYLFLQLGIISKEDVDSGISQALQTLDSKKFLFMIPGQRKFLINIKDNFIILSPIYNQTFSSDAGLYEYYKELFKITLGSLEGFIRSRVHVEKKSIYIEYYDAIDQFFYIIKQIAKSKNLFEQNFEIKDFLNKLACYIVKYIASRELQNLKTAIECNYDHPLNNYRYLSLLTYKLFSKLAYDGSIESLNYKEIIQLAEAITYENSFADMPTMISNCYNNLNKVLPFKTIEKILKKQRVIDYCF